jgi:hypothetical protein
LGPDLDMFGNPWIEDATMEWGNHTIALRASAEVVTHSLDNPREREDAPYARGDESCDVGVIGVDLERPEMVSAVCERYLLVPRFEGGKAINAKQGTYLLPLPQSSSPLLKFSIAHSNR